MSTHHAKSSARSQPRDLSPRLELLTRRIASLFFVLGLLALLVGGDERSYLRPDVVRALVAFLLVWSALGFSVDARTAARRHAGLVALSLAGLAVVALCELTVLVGLVDFRAVFALPALDPIESPRSRLDPELLHVARPGHTKGSWRGGDIAQVFGAPAWTTYSCELDHDARGFRNERELDHADVVVVGDSFVEGQKIPFPELFSSRLVGELGVVANLGQKCYGPQQALVALSRFALGRDTLDGSSSATAGADNALSTPRDLSPGICVWAFYEGNDFEDMSRYEERRGRVRELLAPGRSFAERSLVGNTPRAVRHLAEKLTTTKTASARTVFGDPARRSALVPGPDGPVREYFYYAGEEWSPTRDAALAQYVEITRQAESLCRERGVQLVFLFIPTKYRVYAEIAEIEPDSILARWTLDDLPSRMEQALREISTDIVFVDPSDALRAAAAEGELMYFPDDTHWTSTAHAIAAREILDALNRSKPPSPTR